MGKTLLACCCALCLLALAVPAEAQTKPPTEAVSEEPPDYKRAIDTAIEEFERGNYAEAREHFTRAHALSPNARTLRGLGMVEFELRHYVDAITYLKQALSSDVRRLEGPLREHTRQLLASAQAYVGNVNLQVTPASAEVTVDGFRVEPGDQGTPRTLRLAIGDHVLEFRAEGRLVERRAIKVRGEQTLQLEVTLAEQTLATPSASSGPLENDAAPSEAHRPVYKSWWLWTTVGAVVAGGVVAAVLLTRNKDAKEEPLLTSNTPTGATIRPLTWGY